MKNKLTPIAFIILLVIIASSFIKLPYYVMKPGDAHELAPIVKVTGGKEAEGTLMLTTIKMGEATPLSYALAQWLDYEEIVPIEDVRSPHETDAEYNIRQKYLMDNSQQQAIQVAFDAARKPYKYIYEGVYVLSVFPGMPAEGMIQAGDRIGVVDGRKIESSKQFTDYVQAKQPGDKVTIQFVRDGQEKQKTIALKSFANNRNKAGIGISLTDQKKLISTPEVQLKTESIGGPSAGLMFSLEIYNQLTEKDITKGRRIAGTGTIDSNGKVGRIGGIEQKVVAADRAGAEIFFAPNDEITPELKRNIPNIEPNYKEAVKMAKGLGTDMKIVPVKTFNDALKYLLST
ncbi:SepM family pheromone-processing serine protease [Bacillus sp. REN10]|uniref:SepM family pheromone-processing serine protease n=1 Tax=Bacillus sp. REN10 TaxID=2782541 RepID=UPI00193B7393|nr:SepM family pheromone-processing serine protease [Bacillus sp. REN10]